MKRIESYEEVQKRQKRNRFIYGVFMLFLLVVSTAGYAFLSGTGTDSSTDSANVDSGINNGIGPYSVNLGGQQFSFINSLDKTKDVPVDSVITLDNFYQKPLFIASDSDLVGSEITNNLGRYVPRVQRACYGKCELDLPEKNCSDNLIVYKQSDTRKVYQSQGCVFIDGDLVAVDAFLYKVLDIGQ